VSFSAGTGGWVGRADVYDAAGRFAGPGRDTRTVTPHDDGTTTVDVAFAGPFSFAGTRSRRPTGSGGTSVRSTWASPRR
jgi:hypothetical protein